MLTKLVLLLLLAPWVFAGAAQAGVYRYETDEGTVAFTDDIKRVPSRYRERAEPISPHSFWDYSRLTIVPLGATTEPGSSLMNPGDAFEAASPSDTLPPEPSRVQIKLRQGVLLEVAADPALPIELDEEYRWLDGSYRRHTIVRQGDRILGVRVGP